MSDLLVNLYHRQGGLKEGLRRLEEEKPWLGGVSVYRALSVDKGRVLSFVRTHYEENWVRECEYAFTNSPISCYVAVKDGELTGFACYDATAKGYFGPIGVNRGKSEKGTGQKLLYAVLDAMKEAGYGYAVIGWADEAAGFYSKCLPIYEIPDSDRYNTLYRGLLKDQEK